MEEIYRGSSLFNAQPNNFDNQNVITSIKQPRFGNLSKFFPIVLMKISSPDSDLALKHWGGGLWG